MSRKPAQRRKHFPAQFVIIGALLAAVGVSAVALLMSRPDPASDASITPRAARVERVDGNVGITRALADTEPTEDDWERATVNSPVSMGDRIHANKGSRATLAFTGRNYARLDPGTSLDVLTLADNRTQLALRDGSAMFDLADLAPGELFEVATSNGAVDFYEPGLYQIGYGDDGNPMISVLSGLAQVVGLAGSGQISKGEILTLVGQTAAQALLSRMAPDLAGNIVDDYYGDRYGDVYDGRYQNYDAYLSDPDYYDPYRDSVSYRHYSTYDVPGLNELDDYGSWENVEGYGHCWSPQVADDWAPYRNGYWDANNVWGPTWVSQEPWGWAPYHYGRWALVNNRRWVWVPERAVSRPVYSPALVAFIPITRTNQIGWVPLAPGEPYVARYYDSGFQPRYLASEEYVNNVVARQASYAYMGNPRAVTFVPVPQFTRVIEPEIITRVDSQLLAEARPVIDPYSVQGLRLAAGKHGRGWRKLSMATELQPGVYSTPVVTSTAPAVLPGRGRELGAFQVTTVPEREKRRKLKIDDSGQVISSYRRDGARAVPIPQPDASGRVQDRSQERAQRIAALRTQADGGDRAARREMRELKREQQKEVKIERRQTRQNGQNGTVQSYNPQQTVQQPVSERARAARKEQRRAERQQRMTYQQQQSQPAQINQSRQERKGQRRLERQQRQVTDGGGQRQASQQAAQRAQVEQLRQQRKAQRRLERQQQPQAYQQQQEHQQRAMREQQANQRKQSVQVQQVNKEQRKQERQERRAARQQAAQQVVMPQQRQSQGNPRVEYMGPPASTGSVDRAQRKAEKAERRAARGKQ